MKLEILKDNLDAAVGLVGRISNKNLSLPVLGCVVIEAVPDRVIVKATNLDLSVEVALKAKILEGGLAAVPAGILMQAVATATDQKLELTNSGTSLTISGPHGKADLKTLDASEFPKLPYVKEGQGTSVSLPSRELARALKAAAFAASSSGMRPELSSVFLSIDGAHLIAAATDSFRLAEMRLPLKAKAADPILIPVRNIPDLIRVIEGGDTAEMRIGESQVTFVAGGNYITSRTVDAAFPEYRAIIPKSFGSSATMLTEDAARAFRKVSVFTDAYSEVQISLLPSQKSFSIKAANTSVGEGYEQVDASLEGDDIVMSFNARYILDALPTTTSDSIVFKIAGPGKPMVIEEVPAHGFTYLVMPMNK